MSKLSHYKPNEELIQSTARIKKQRDVILDRVQKMDFAKEKVSQNVYEKVKRDYSLQLQTITELLNEKKDDLKKEIRELYVRREKLTIEINRHKEILEEAEFRLFLGEFSQNQFQEVENFETKEIEKLEADLSLISQFIHTHEELFDPEDLGLPAKKKQSDVTRTTPPKTSSATVETVAAPVTQQPTQAKTEKTQTTVVQPQVTQQQLEEADSVTIKKDLTKSEKDPLPKNDDAVVDPSEFEDLFLDDEPASQDTQSENEVVLTEEKSTESDIADEDYFKEEKVSETSFTLSPADLQNIIEEPSTNQEDKQPELADHEQTSSNIKTEIHLKQDALETVPEDSISDILNSLPQNASPATVIEEKKKSQEPRKNDLESLYYLKLIEGEHDQKEFPLKENISIGRSPSSDIVLKAPKVSRQHAAINMYNNQYIIIDLKSSNGVYVNGTKIDECVLNSGDEISVGGYRFIFTDKIDN